MMASYHPERLRTSRLDHEGCVLVVPDFAVAEGGLSMMASCHGSQGVVAYGGPPEAPRPYIAILVGSK